jgi:hypothetical protein
MSNWAPSDDDIYVVLPPVFSNAQFLNFDWLLDLAGDDLIPAGTVCDPTVSMPLLLDREGSDIAGVRFPEGFSVELLIQALDPERKIKVMGSFIFSFNFRPIMNGLLNLICAETVTEK